MYLYIYIYIYINVYAYIFLHIYECSASVVRRWCLVRNDMCGHPPLPLRLFSAPPPPTEESCRGRLNMKVADVDLT